MRFLCGWHSYPIREWIGFFLTTYKKPERLRAYNTTRIKHNIVVVKDGIFYNDVIDNRFQLDLEEYDYVIDEIVRMINDESSGARTEQK
ncbi:hypothetical protein C0Q44_01605 [Paenibacillus sp. PCH8]|nr:hypothetical protein C0Q44_01605 [Paenibacillus sp. PCH8]